MSQLRVTKWEWPMTYCRVDERYGLAWKSRWNTYHASESEGKPVKFDGCRKTSIEVFSVWL